MKGLAAMKRLKVFGVLVGGVYFSGVISSLGLRSIAIEPSPTPTPTPSPSPAPSPSPTPSPSPAPSPAQTPTPKPLPPPAPKPSPQPASDPKPSNSIWRLFTSEAGGFKVLMPGEAKVAKADDLTSFRVDRPQEGAVYIVSYVDFDGDPALEQDGIRDAFAGTAQGIADEGGKILTTKTLALGSYPGQEIQAKLANGMTTRIRAYIVEKRFYLVIATTKSDRNLTKSIEGYLNSFQLIRR